MDNTFRVNYAKLLDFHTNLQNIFLKYKCFDDLTSSHKLKDVTFPASSYQGQLPWDLLEWNNLMKQVYRKNSHERELIQWESDVLWFAEIVDNYIGSLEVMWEGKPSLFNEICHERITADDSLHQLFFEPSRNA